MNEPLLNAAELGSSAWVKVEAYMERRIESLRIELEKDKGDVETAKIRGRIDELKVFLRVARAPRGIVVDAGR